MKETKDAKKVATPKKTAGRSQRSANLTKGRSTAKASTKRVRKAADTRSTSTGRAKRQPVNNRKNAATSRPKATKPVQQVAKVPVAPLITPDELREEDQRELFIGAIILVFVTVAVVLGLWAVSALVG